MATKNTLKFFAWLFLAASIALLISGSVFLDQSKKASMPQEREEKKSKSNKMFIAFAGMLLGCFIFFGLANSQVVRTLKSGSGSGSESLQPQSFQSESVQSGSGSKRYQHYENLWATLQSPFSKKSLSSTSPALLEASIKVTEAEEGEEARDILIIDGSSCNEKVYKDDKEMKVYKNHDTALEEVFLSKPTMPFKTSNNDCYKYALNTYKVYNNEDCKKPKFYLTTGLRDKNGVHIPILRSKKDKNLRFVPKKKIVGKAVQEFNPDNYINFEGDSFNCETVKEIKRDYGLS